MSKVAARAGTPDYEEAKRHAASPDAEAREALAGTRGTRPEILYFLSEDPATSVRRAVAGNPGTPIHAALILSHDDDDDVRCDLAAEVAKRAPILGDAHEPGDDTHETGAKSLRDIAIEILEGLARDEVVRVRVALAEALKDVAKAPPEVIERVIKRLANDSEIAVAGPILEHSPLLTEADLMAIAEAVTVGGALAAIARRRSVGVALSDAIAGRATAADGKGDVQAEAITALLANPSAQIREETLDRIIDAAPDRPAWHPPLVRWPTLAATAARRLAGFVAHTLLNELAARKDLDPDTAAAVADAVKARLEDEAAAAAAPAETSAATRKKKKAAAHGKESAEPGGAMAEARKLKAAGKLDEDALSNALLRGRRSLVRAGLALLAELPEAVVDKIVDSRSAKGMTALAWKAETSMRFAVQLQIRLAGIAPNAVLNARGGVGYPLSAEDLTWQIEFFSG